MKKLLLIILMMLPFIGVGQTFKEIQELANQKYDNGDYYGQITELSKIIDNDPEYAKNHMVYYLRGCSKQLLNDYNGALKDYSLEGKIFADLEKRKAECFYRLGEYKKTIVHCNKALEIYNDYDTAYFFRGLAKYKLKDLYGSVADFTSAINIKTEEGSFSYDDHSYYFRGLAKEKIGDTNGACNDWKKAVKLGYQDASKLVTEKCN